VGKKKKERKEERKKCRRILKFKFIFVHIISKWTVSAVTNSEIFYIFQILKSPFLYLF